MAKHLPLFLLSLSLLLSFCIQLVLVDKPPSLSCKENQFACQDGSKCIPKSKVCNGYGDGCPDDSHNFASQCDNCTADHLFSCKSDGVNICLNVKFQCDGFSHCDDGADELLSVCGPCTENQFACQDGSKCIPKEWVCNGYTCLL